MRRAKRQTIPKTTAKADASSGLLNLPLFAGLRKATLDHISAHSELLDLPHGRVLFSAGEAPAGLYFVVSGSVSITMPGRSSERDIVVRLMRAGDVFDTSALISNTPHVVAACTASRTRLVCVARHDMITLLERDATLSYRILRDLSRTVRELLGKTTNMAVREPAAISIVKLLLDELPASQKRGSATVAFSSSQRAIAQSLHITPEHFSRVLKQLSDAQLIEVNRPHISIPHIERLRAFARHGRDRRRASE